MANVSGSIVQISPSVFTWILRSESRKDICTSESIYICENKYEFYFRLFKIREDFYTLHLLNPQIVFVKLDMYIVLDFNFIKLDPKMENYEVMSFDHFIVGIRTAREILDITFTFSNAQDLKKPGFETANFYNTIRKYGKLVQISPITFTWKLDSEDSNLKRSDNIQICGNKYTFYFRLMKIREDFYTLHLLNPQIVFVKLNFNIVVTRSHTTTDHTLDNYKVKSFDQFILDVSDAKDISEITFTFSNVKDVKNPVLQTTKIIHRTLNLSRNTDQTSLSKYTWKLGSEIRKNVSTSETMYVCGNKYEFYFRLFKMREDFYTLHLLNPEIYFVKLDMNIVVKFSEISRDYTLENYEVKSFDQFILGISHADNISEITLSFSNAQDLKQVVCENGFSILCGELQNAFLSEEDSDIILRVGDQQYPAHKVIIRNRSSVFRAMLQHDMTEKKEGIVDIEDCDPYIFRDFLLYLYSGKLDNISKENAFELYYVSDKYNVNPLKLDCIDYIMDNINTDIVCDVIALATKHSERDVLEHAVNFFIENAEDIFLTEQWQVFLKENTVQANELIIKAFKNKSRKQQPTAPINGTY